MALHTRVSPLGLQQTRRSVGSSRNVQPNRKLVLRRSVEKDSTNRPVREKDLGVGLKAAWYGAEVFGDLLAKGKKAEGEQDSSSSEARAAAAAAAGSSGKPIDAVLESIRADYAEDYFISGKGEMADYDPECLFADPFVSFRGVERFKKNVANLGAVISDVDLQITKWDVQDNTLEAHWKFSAILDLPWRPRLAAAGSTTHVIDASRGLVVEHIERWKSEPGEVVQRLLKPSSKIPTNQWESFMANLSAGDAKGCWYVVNRKVALYAAPVVAISLAVHAATGHGLPGVLGGGVVEVLAGVLLAAGLSTEAFKYIEGTGQI
ncbi:hypothetical protein OEZ86_003727 [Tetradesmus obliquus]|nr:hypothetical protein OEZ86_003727 [Tetradesmus obliquus]